MSVAEGGRYSGGSDRDLVAAAAASAAAPTYPVARGVRNYRSNECVQRKYAPMATGVALCPLLLFARCETCVPTNIRVRFAYLYLRGNYPRAQLLAERSHVRSCASTKNSPRCKWSVRWSRLVIIHRIHVRVFPEIHVFNLLCIYTSRWIRWVSAKIHFNSWNVKPKC